MKNKDITVIPYLYIDRFGYTRKEWDELKAIMGENMYMSMVYEYYWNDGNV